ncbi:MAG: hypothetical protein NWF03_00295 [Candidatus Bathyarchaeota archaeon]|nr:hypothetical protein [Candidatus Bathyarchaeota archaeon]
MISSDTTWTKANSPYYLTGNLVVSTGVTLTIQSGVTVNMGGCQLIVNGTLRAKGSSTDLIQFNNGGRIVFTEHSSNWTEQTDSGCILENANLTSTEVNVGPVSPKIANNNLSTVFGGGAFIADNTISNYLNAGSNIVSNNIVSNEVYVSSDSATITNNEILGILIVEHCSPIIENNKISGQMRIKGSPDISGNTILGGILVTTGTVSISNNEIHGGIDLSPGNYDHINASIINNAIIGGAIGIRIAPADFIFLHADHHTDAYIYGNIITNCTTAGIEVGSSSSQGGYDAPPNSAIIKRNIIMNNSIGVTGRGEITNNTITNNVFGVDTQFKTLIWNNIYNNTNGNVKLNFAVIKSATNNWWGTTNTDEIIEKIYFDFDTSTYQLTTLFSFTPILTEPNPESPSLQNLVIPEFPTWTILPLLISVAVFALLYKHKLAKTPT